MVEIEELHKTSERAGADAVRHTHLEQGGNNKRDDNGPCAGVTKLIVARKREHQELDASLGEKQTDAGERP